MTYRLKVIIFAAVILVGVGAGFFILRPSQKESAPSSNPNNPKVTEQGEIPAEDFSYQKPKDWATLSKEALDPHDAVSGMSRIAAPAASFTVKVSSSTPKSDDELKNSTLDDIKKNASNFELISSGATNIDNHAGQKFTYKYGSGNKTKQELSVIVYKQKTFFLLFTAAEADFDKQQADFDKILSDFKFN